MLSTGLDSAIPAIKKPQTYDLDCKATGLDITVVIL
jgi:hypothetical protein